MISVVIPLFHKEKTIIHTLNTILSQSYQDYEVIIVYDEEDDQSVELVRQSILDPRFKLVKQDKRGVSSARNKGVEESRSEWVFLDADDEWQPNYLKTIVHLIENNPDVNIVGTGGYIKNFKTGLITPVLINKYANKEVVLNYFINADIMPHIGATAIRKKIFFEVGGFPEGIWACEDICLRMKIALTSKIAYSGLPLHVYMGEVDGQLTAVGKNRKVEARECEGYVFSDVYSRYINNSMGNPLVPIFLKYKLRHFYLIFLKEKDYVSVNAMNDNLSVDLKRLLGNWFVRINTCKFCRNLLILYILATKVRWRLRGYPVAGERIDNEKEWISKYVNIV